MTPHLELLNSELRDFDLDLSSENKGVLARYCDELVRWNQKINLTGLAGAALVRRLVVEPAWIARELNFFGVLVDIGSGNGSPAIPLHVLSQVEQTHLVESRAKRAAFLRHVVSTLKLSNVTVHHALFEETAATFNGPDWITLQGVALTEQLIDSIRSISSSTTTVVWITSPAVLPTRIPKKILSVPVTGTQVFLFQLDLS